MLSIFPDSKEFPLIFACYDRIMAASPSFKKTVLLHADNEPTVNGNTVTLTNGGGKLVATYFSDNELEIEAIGGEGRNRMMNGTQVPLDKFRGEGWYTPWGRLEICPKIGRRNDDVLAVMYVADEENEKTLEVTNVSTFGIVGATVMNNALLFIKSIVYPDRIYEINVPGEGEMTYYVSGLSAGKWKARVGKKSLTINVKADERFARFTAPAGNLTLSKM